MLRGRNRIISAVIAAVVTASAAPVAAVVLDAETTMVVVLDDGTQRQAVRTGRARGRASRGASTTCRSACGSRRDRMEHQSSCS